MNVNSNNKEENFMIEKKQTYWKYSCAGETIFDAVKFSEQFL